MQVYYGFMCNNTLRDIYLVAITVIGCLTIMVTMLPVFQTVKYHKFRASMFFGMGVSGVVPCIHKLFLHSTEPGAIKTLTLEVLMGMLYAAGAVVYATRIPERWAPGKFDIAGNSHQLFHMLVVAGAYVHYQAGLMYLRWRDANGCDFETWGQSIFFFFFFGHLYFYQWETVEITSLQGQLPLWTKLLSLWSSIPVSGLKVLVILIILVKVIFKFLMQEDDVCCHICSGCWGTKQKLAAQICSWNCVAKIKRKLVSFWNNTDIGSLIHLAEFLEQSNLRIPSSDMHSPWLTLATTAGPSSVTQVLI